MFKDFTILADDKQSIVNQLVSAGLLVFMQGNDDEGTVDEYVPADGVSLIEPRRLMVSPAEFDDQGNETKPSVLGQWACALRVLESVDLGDLKTVDVDYSLHPNFGPLPKPPEPAKPITPYDLPLNAVQFEAILRILEVTDEMVESVIDQVFKDPAENAVAKAKFHKSENYNRDNPLFAALAPVLGKSDEQLDMAWMMAAQIQ